MISSYLVDSQLWVFFGLLATGEGKMMVRVTTHKAVCTLRMTARDTRNIPPLGARVATRIKLGIFSNGARHAGGAGSGY